MPLIQSRKMSLTGTFRFAKKYPLAVYLIPSGVVKLDAAVIHHFNLAKTEDALTVARRDFRFLTAAGPFEPTPAAGRLAPDFAH